MSDSVVSNHIARRIDEMTHLWEQFRSAPQARVCQWVIDPDEKAMVDAFLETTYQDENEIPDFFLPFYTPFTTPARYARQLIEELAENIAADREALLAEGLRVDWQPDPPEPGQDAGVKYFLRQLRRFAQQFPEAELTVAALAPAVATPAFGPWLAEALRVGIPANLRLLVITLTGEELPEEMATRFPGQLLTTRLDLNTPVAMRQLSLVGDPADPGVAFRNAFLAVAQAATNEDVPEVKRLEALPLAIARQHGWHSMEIAVHSLVASALIGADQLREALLRYERAFHLAQQAKAAGEPSANALAIQCLFNQGSVMISLKMHPEAAQAYAGASVLAQEAGDALMVMESKRMEGYCLEQSGQWIQAFRVEREALVAAESVDENTRHHSTLPFLGQSLLELAYRLGDKNQYAAITEKMQALAGANWQVRLQRSQTPDQ